MDHIRDDVVYAWRRLRATPGFTLIAVLTLALGIGANTALFSLVNGILFKSIPVKNFDRLVTVTGVRRANDRLSIGISEDDLRAIESSRVDAFETFFTSDPLIGALTARSQAEVVTGELISGHYFEALGQVPRAGRLLQPSDDSESGSETPIVISERLWHRRFGGEAAAIGRSVKIAGYPLVIVGVAPDSFQGTWLPTIFSVDVWIPTRATGQIRTVQGSASVTSHRTFAKLRPDASLEQADVAIQTIGRRLHADDPAFDLTVRPGRTGMLPQEFDKYGRLLGGAVLALSCLVFLIACANLTNLLMVRGAARTGELAIRKAMGASPGRIFRLMVVETLLFTILSGLAGVALTFVTTRVMAAVELPSVEGMSIRFDPSPDLSVFAYAFVLASLAAFVVGIIPAWRASRAEPLRHLAAAGAGGSTVRGHRLWTALVASQIAMSIVLLLGAGLYARSAVKAMSFDHGFDLTHGVVASVDLRLHKIEEARGRQIYRRMLDVARGTPGVERAAIASELPVAGRGTGTHPILTEGEAAPPVWAERVGAFSVVSPGLLEALGIQLRRGRDFVDQDVASSTRVVIVNEAAAAALWPHQNPLGKRVQIKKGGPLLEVVGVAANTATGWASDRVIPYFFLPLEQEYWSHISIVARTSGSPAGLVEPLRQALAGVDPDVAVFSAATMSERVGLQLVPFRIAAMVLGCLGLLGFGIAVLGLYGVIAHIVTQRTREFGIRRALGASGPQLHAIVIGQGLRMLLYGVAPGIVAAFLLAGLLKRLIFGIEPHDPLTFVTVPLALVAVGLAASYVPARRAARIDPCVALRDL